MTPFTTGYEIKLIKPDGTISIAMKVTAVGDLDARAQAAAALTGSQ
jgi:hypothetical protein